MPHPAMTRLRHVLPPPPSGGDTVDWEGLSRTEGLTLPSDYREYVEVYGGGEIDEYLSISTPPVLGSAYDDLLDGLTPALRPEDEAELAPYFPGGPLKLLAFGGTASADELIWLRVGDPDSWKIAVFRRQTPHGQSGWTVFDGGMAELLLAVFDGNVDPFSARALQRETHTFLTWHDIRNL